MTAHRAQKATEIQYQAVAPSEAMATPTMKGPRLAIAAVKPMAPPAWRLGMIIGICLKVEALPTPAKKNMASRATMKMVKSAGSSAPATR